MSGAGPTSSRISSVAATSSPAAASLRDSGLIWPDTRALTHWQWRNVPLPEPYLASMAIALLLHLVVPLRLPLPRSPAMAIGLPVVAMGIGLAAWAVASAADTPVDEPDRVVTTGAYAVSRNPMYLGWSAMVAGIGVMWREGWVLITAAAAAGKLLREVTREESSLAATFGPEYADYRSRMRRVL
jgi:protein-S-isoprenylcysteine O-methyltransferase Ste14